MKRFMNKKVIAIGLAAGLTLGIAGAAFAYFSDTGSGTGSGATGSPSTFTIAQDSSTPATGLTPGGPTDQIAYTVTNPNTGFQKVGAVTVAVAANSATGDIESVPGSVASDVTGCLAVWFTVNNPTQTLNQDIPGTTAGGNTFDETVSAQAASVTSIQMTNVNSLQNACQGATVGLTFTSTAVTS
jgi:hypothetical protein